MSKYITTHEELIKLHGKKVTCKIEGKYIDDAKICVDFFAYVYVCQNKRKGKPTTNYLGYEYSWLLSNNGNPYENNNQQCTEIQLVNAFEYKEPGEHTYPLVEFTEFESGEEYVWVGPKSRQRNFNTSGGMDFILDGRPHKCNLACDSTASFFDSPSPDHKWVWRDDLHNLRKAVRFKTHIDKLYASKAGKVSKLPKGRQVIENVSKDYKESIERQVTKIKIKPKKRFTKVLNEVKLSLKR